MAGLVSDLWGQLARLVFVAAIIPTVAWIAITPRFSSSCGTPSLIVCGSRMRQLGTMAELYGQDPNHPQLVANAPWFLVPHRDRMPSESLECPLATRPPATVGEDGRAVLDVGTVDYHWLARPEELRSLSATDHVAVCLRHPGYVNVLHGDLSVEALPVADFPWSSLQESEAARDE